MPIPGYSHTYDSFIGNIAGEKALTAIYRSCIQQLIKVYSILLSSINTVFQIGVISPTIDTVVDSCCAILSSSSLSLSARSIRQIPAVAYAKCMKKSMELETFMPFLQAAIQEKKEKLTSHV